MKRIYIYKLLPLLVVLLLGACSSNNLQVGEKKSVKKSETKVSVKRTKLKVHTKPLFVNNTIQKYQKQKLKKINPPREIRTFKGHTKWINSVAITPNGKYIVSGSGDKTIKLWNIKTGRLLRNFKGHTDGVLSVAITPNGKYIVSGSSDKTIKLWDIKTGKLIRSFKKKIWGVLSVTISPNGKYIVSGSYDNTIKLWDINTGILVRSFKGSRGRINSVTIAPNGKYISGGYYSAVKLWDINTGKLIRSFKGHKDDVSSVAISPNGKYIVSGSGDKTIKLWNINTGRLIRSFKGHTDGILSVAITPNGKHIVSGSHDNTIKLWNINTGKLIRSFKGHTDWVASIAISPNGKYIVSGSSDDKIKLWNILENKANKKTRLAWNKFVKNYTASNNDLIALNKLAKKYPNIKKVKNHLKKLFEYKNSSNGFRFKNFQRLSTTQQSNYLKLNNKDKQLFASLNSKKQREFLKASATKKAWFRVFALVNRDMETYLNEPYISSKPPKVPTIEIIADVEEPELPPVKRLKKSASENRAMFNKRLDKMKAQRAKQIQSVMQLYREKVDTRNQRVKELQVKYNNEYSKYKKDFAKYKSSEKQKQLKYKNKREQELLSAYYSFVFGKAKLRHLKHKRKYNAKTGVIHAMLYWGNKKNPLYKKEIAFKVNAKSGKAKSFYNTLKQGKIRPDVKLSFKGKRFAIHRVNVNYKNKDYLANLNVKGFIAQKPVVISLGYKNPNKVQDTTKLVKKQEQKLDLQTSNIKDVQFEVALDSEIEEFNDKEIRKLFAN